MGEFCTHERHGGFCEKTDTYCNLGACPYEDMKAVSYTHLDVYKRQAERRSFVALLLRMTKGEARRMTEERRAE